MKEKIILRIVVKLLTVLYKSTKKKYPNISEFDFIENTKYSIISQFGREL